jgi:hypothetical protein
MARKHADTEPEPLRFVFAPRGRRDPQTIGLIRGSYDRDGKVLAPPLIVAADHPQAQPINADEHIEVAETDTALLHIVENTHKHLFHRAR